MGIHWVGLTFGDHFVDTKQKFLTHSSIYSIVNPKVKTIKG
jgi:hypothetical protein